MCQNGMRLKESYSKEMSIEETSRDRERYDKKCLQDSYQVYHVKYEISFCPALFLLDKEYY